MKKCIIFSTPGYLEIQSTTTFGVSTKGDDAIGFFRTGLKYAIAICLRFNQQVSIQHLNARGRVVDEHVFTTKPVEISGKVFQVIHMDNIPCAFTTEVGKNWSLLDAYREFYCNTIDAKGVDLEGVVEGTIATMKDGYIRKYKPSNPSTRIIVSGDEFYKGYKDKSTFLLQPNLLHSTPEVEIHYGKSSKVYYRGIAVHNLQYHSKYTYNILGKIELTEDRTAKDEYILRYRISQALSTLTNPHVIESVLLAGSTEYEHYIYYSDQTVMTTEFKGVVIREANKFNFSLNKSAYDLLKSSILEDLAKKPSTATVEDTRCLQIAITLCHKIGYAVDESSITIVDNLGVNILGMTDGKSIFISRECLNMGMRVLVGTLIEEYAHLKLSLQDCSREFQNHLLNALVSKSFRLLGEYY